MATKLSRIMLHDPLITWPCEIRGSLSGGGGSAHKRLSRHQLLAVVLLIQDGVHIAIFLFSSEY